MEKIDKEKRGCLILGNSNIRYLSNSDLSVDFYGFTEEESNGASTWRWAVTQQTYLVIIGKSGKSERIEFEVKGAPCFDEQVIEFLDYCLKNGRDKLFTKNFSVNKEKNLGNQNGCHFF
jgi:hypothetical protein